MWHAGGCLVCFSFPPFLFPPSLSLLHCFLRGFSSPLTIEAHVEVTLTSCPQGPDGGRSWKVLTRGRCYRVLHFKQPLSPKPQVTRSFRGTEAESINWEQWDRKDTVGHTSLQVTLIGRTLGLPIGNHNMLHINWAWGMALFSIITITLDWYRKILIHPPSLTLTWMTS